ncbi:hypothetical protein X546_19750 [Brevibacillus borstelensis cifa_chp40]|nr:hypothetical protein X546_19750 [Brevibacillus borstelensis cifa_chp40]
MLPTVRESLCSAAATGPSSMFLIGILVVVAIVAEIFHRLNPWKKPEPPYEELIEKIKQADWYQELWQDEACRHVLETDPHVLAYYSGTYEAKRLLENRGFQLGLIDYVKEQAEKVVLNKR